MIITGTDFSQVVTGDVPLMDVRAPVEFISGSIPNSTNLPLLNDEERERVGTCYKEQGQDQAVHLGHQLVGGRDREQRVAAWCDFVKVHTDTILYCSRGGMRSEIAQQWIREQTGRAVPRLMGGYKAFRNFLLDCFEPSFVTSTPVILGGRTGSGKTQLLGQLQNSIDLEGLANHRGSTFGRFLTPQPGQADFENRLACALIRHIEKKSPYLILEDEGRHVGKRYLPKSLSDYFATGPVVILETPVEDRVQNTYDEYVLGAQADYRNDSGSKNGLAAWLTDMENSLGRIAKRLGGERFQQARELLNRAYDIQVSTGSAEEHKYWVRLLLEEYYDPMYDYQIREKNRLVVFSGDVDSVTDYLQKMQ